MQQLDVFNYEVWRCPRLSKKYESVLYNDYYFSEFYKILTCFIHLYFCLPLFASAVRRFVLKEDFAFTTIYKMKVPFQYEYNFLLYWIVSMVDYGICKFIVCDRIKYCFTCLYSQIRLPKPQSHKGLLTMLIRPRQLCMIQFRKKKFADT